MLVLTRRESERLLIGPDIVVTVVRVENGRVRIGIEAPRDMKIWRNELLPIKTARAEEIKG